MHQIKRKTFVLMINRTAAKMNEFRAFSQSTPDQDIHLKVPNFFVNIMSGVFCKERGTFTFLDSSSSLQSRGSFFRLDGPVLTVLVLLSHILSSSVERYTDQNTGIFAVTSGRCYAGRVVSSKDADD